MGRGKGVWRWEKRKNYSICLSLQCHHQKDSICTMMGSDESHFNVSLIGRGKMSHKTVSTKHRHFEEKREPKRNRAKALLRNSL